jgi:hypothetical protein
MGKLALSLSKTTKPKSLPGVIVKKLGTKASIKISGTGSTISGVVLYGGIGEVGDTVDITFVNGIPHAQTVSTPLSSITTQIPNQVPTPGIVEESEFVRYDSNSLAGTPLNDAPPEDGQSLIYDYLGNEMKWNDIGGLQVAGIGFSIYHWAYGDDALLTNRRDMWFQMKLNRETMIPYATWQLTAGSSESIVVNGDAEHGDLSHWSQSGTKFEVISDVVHDGAFGFHCNPVDEGDTEVLTSARSLCAEITTYSFSMYTRERFDYNPTTVRLSTYDANYIEMWVYETTVFADQAKVGCSYNMVRFRTLVKFDISTIPTFKSILAASWRMTVGAAKVGKTYSIYQMNTAWDHSAATWQKKNGSTSWQSAGASGANDADYGHVFGAFGQNGVKTIALDTSLMASYLTGNNYGFIFKQNSEANPPDADNNTSVTINLNDPFYIDVTYIPWGDQSYYTVKIKWYDNTSGGTLLRTDDWFSQNGNTGWNLHQINLKSPIGAQSFEVVITATFGNEFWFDDINAVSVIGEIGIDSAPYIVDANGVRGNIMGSVRDGFIPWKAPAAALKSTYTTVSPDFDSFIQSDTATTNYGTNTALNIGESNAAVRTYRGLIKPVLSAYSGKTVQAARLWITPTADLATNAPTIKAYRILRDWVEAEVTWTIWKAANNWASLGAMGSGDYDNNVVGSLALTAAETLNVAKGMDLDTTLFQSLIDSPSTYFGLLLKSDSESNDAYTFASSDHGTSGYRPFFVIAFSDDGNLSDGQYKYKYTFVDKSGESTPSAVSNTVTVDRWSQKVDLTIPLGPDGTVSRKIYRTAAGGATYKYVGTIADNSTTAYTDNVADADLGAEPPGSNTTTSRSLFPTQDLKFIQQFNWDDWTGVSWNITASQPYAHYIAKTAVAANDGHWCETGMFLAAGNYQFQLQGVFTTDSGIVDIYLDGINIGSIDMYASSTTYNSIRTIYPVAVIGNGYHHIRLVVNGKNASSTDFRMCLTCLYVNKVMY